MERAGEGEVTCGARGPLRQKRGIPGHPQELTPTGGRGAVNDSCRSIIPGAEARANSPTGHFPLTVEEAGCVMAARTIPQPASMTANPIKWWLMAKVLAASVAVPLVAAPVPEALRPFFAPPAEFAGQFGAYASPLRYDDGRPVGSPAEWPARRVALNHAVAVNRFLGHENRVAMTHRPAHSPTAESNGQAFLFLEHFLQP